MGRPLTLEQLTYHLRDTTEGLYGFRWDHYDHLSWERANAAMEAINADDFVRRAYHQQRERLYEELMDRIRMYLPESAITGREGGEVWQEYQVWKKEHPDEEDPA